MKRILAILVMVLSIVSAQAKEAYGVLIGETLTIYYDDLRSSREGKTFDMYKNSDFLAWWETDDVKTITKVIFDSSIAYYRPTSLIALFDGFSSLCEIDGINLLNTSNVTDMGAMFRDCRGLTTLDLSNFNTSNVMGMWEMFSGCIGLTTLDLSNFNTSKVTTMGGMFDGCRRLITLDLSNFNTSNVIVMEGMFRDCKGLTTLDLSNFNTSKVTNMGGMFHGCSGLTTLDLSNFNTSNVKYMDNMFYYCRGLTTLDLSHFKTSNVTDMGYMFYYCSGLTTLDLSNFNTSNVTNMGEMFNGCSSLTSLDLSNFNTSNVTNMHRMFLVCSGLTTLDLSHFDTSNVTDMHQMFDGCSGLTTLDLSNFNTSNVMGMGGMFRGCSGLTTLDLSNFNTSKVTNMYGMFDGCSSLTTLDLSHFNTSKVTIMNSMFNGCSRLEKVTIGENFTQLPDKAFAESDKIISFTALMEQPFVINSNCFTDNVKANATLNVPKGTRATYESTEGWKEFKHIYDGTDDVKKCEKPTIIYQNGKLTFNCDTEGAICHSTVTDDDIKSYDGNEIQLGVTYIINVYATKEGYQNSETATATLCWIDVEPKTEGITDGIAQVSARTVMVKAEGGQLTVEGAEDDTNISIYSINGVQVGTTISRNGVASILTAISKDSIVIVKIGNKSVKVVMR